MSGERMKPEHLRARLIRALSGLTQEQMSEETGIPASLIDQFEQGKVVPGEDHLERMAACTGTAAADSVEHLRLYRTQRETYLRGSEAAGTILDHLATRLRRHCSDAFDRLLTLQVPEPPPAPEDRQRAEELFANLRRLSHRSKLAVVRTIPDYQSWALAERCCGESARQAPHNLKRAASWAQTALEIAQLAPGSKGWRSRLQGYALAHWADVLRLRGEPSAAEAARDKAKDLWEAGSDSAGLLDPGRLRLER